MRVKNLLHEQPLKRNDSMNHNRGFSISIGGTGPVAFGHSLRYLINRIRLAITGQMRSMASAVSYRFADFIVGNFLLFIYFAGTLVIPSGFNPRLTVTRAFNAFCVSIKKGIDFFGSLIGLILLMPLFLLIGILIKLDSPGPVFYTQTRIGLNRRRKSRRGTDCRTGAERRSRDRRRENHFGKPFRVYKFRTMIDNAEKKCGPIWATRNDPRITRVGAFLRKTRMDELPQLINVLKGEMSLIGPRPERPVFIRDLSTKVDGYVKRLDVKPGITGLAQVENGYDSSMDSVKDKVAYDLRYINRWSLWQDIKILLKTVIVVITGKGAF
jgi:lipopolysaccharide/colanic/teichoic acid biosynthesis glycosyltransferase